MWKIFLNSRQKKMPHCLGEAFFLFVESWFKQPAQAGWQVFLTRQGAYQDR